VWFLKLDDAVESHGNEDKEESGETNTSLRLRKLPMVQLLLVVVAVLLMVLPMLMMSLPHDEIISSGEGNRSQEIRRCKEHRRRRGGGLWHEYRLLLLLLLHFGSGS